MHLFGVMVLALSIATVHADLVCLGWGLISPVVGLICHFKPDAFHAAENATITAVEGAVDSAKDLVEFDITHNPAAITYNFVNTAYTQGVAQGVQGVTQSIHDFQNVTIGFAKGSANQVVQIYDLAYWGDVSFCLIRSAGHLVSQAKRKSRKRTGVPSTGDAVGVARGCISDKLKQLAKPAVFNITDPNQKVGSTISDIASLFIPVAPEGETAVDLATGAVDLAIPGSEDTSRILKKVGDQGVAQHFVDEQEAQAVAENLNDKSWVEQNCGTCPLFSSPAASIGTSRIRRGNRSPLSRRGNAFSSCCSVPATISTSDSSPNPFANVLGDFDVSPDGYESVGEVDQGDPSQDLLNDPIYDPSDYGTLGEADLVPASSYTMWDLNAAGGVQSIQKDLDVLSTAVVGWSPEIEAVTSSEELFSSLRKTFSGPSTDLLYQQLKIRERDGKLRLTAISASFMEETDPVLKPLQDFVTAAINHGKDVVTKLKNLPAQDAERLDGVVEFFWTGPSNEALTGVDPRGLHIDNGLMQFGAADTPGLIVKNEVADTLSRVPIVKNAFQCMKAYWWDFEESLVSGMNTATEHSVFGPEMAKDGRVSMVMTVFYKRAVPV